MQNMSEWQCIVLLVESRLLAEVVTGGRQEEAERTTQQDVYTERCCCGFSCEAVGIRWQQRSSTTQKWPTPLANYDVFLDLAKDTFCFLKPKQNLCVSLMFIMGWRTCCAACYTFRYVITYLVTTQTHNHTTWKPRPYMSVLVSLALNVEMDPEWELVPQEKSLGAEGSTSCSTRTDSEPQESLCFGREVIYWDNTVFWAF